MQRISSAFVFLWIFYWIINFCSGVESKVYCQWSVEDKIIDCSGLNLTRFSEDNFVGNETFNNTIYTSEHHLDLSSNNIDNLDELTWHENIESLDLSCNRISHVDRGGKDLGDLRNLNLSYNGINTLGRSFFKHMVTLEVLDLSNNEIKFIGGNTFVDLVKLAYLNLSSNELSSFYMSYSQSQQGTLRTLSLRNNSNLSNINFGGPWTLQKLDVSCTMIHSLSLNVSNKWPGVIILGGRFSPCIHSPVYNVVCGNCCPNPEDCGNDLTTDRGSSEDHTSGVQMTSALNQSPFQSKTSPEGRGFAKEENVVYICLAGLAILILFLLMLFIQKWHSTRKQFERYRRGDEVYGMNNIYI